MNRLSPILRCVLGLTISCAACAQSVPLEEASGVTRLEDHLLIVDDDRPGVYFRCPVKQEKGPVIRLGVDRLKQISLQQANLAVDLEAIDVLTDGRVVVLSERQRTLFDSNGIVAEYDTPLSEFGKRGLEGLAVQPRRDNTSRVAVLWEGGYPEYIHVPEQLRPHAGRVPLQPLVQIHDIKPDQRGVIVRSSKLVKLEVPSPSGRAPRAQRFRAPDLVWHRNPDGKPGFIALLSSHNSLGRRTYQYHWLQRFSVKGKRIGDPLDLDQIVPKDLKGANWEGLGWFEEGKSLVIVHESFPKDDAVAYVLELPESWRNPSYNPSTFTHWLKSETDYYLKPQRSRPPDGKLAPGTKVKMIEGDGSYCLVETDTALKVYVRTASLKSYEKRR